MNDSGDLSSDTSQKCSWERGIVWNGDNGFKVLKVMTFAWYQHVLRPKIVCLKSQKEFWKIQHLFSERVKKYKKECLAGAFYVIGEHKSTNRTFGQTAIIFNFGENINQANFKVVFVSKDLFQSCRVWAVDNTYQIIIFMTACNY